MSGELVRYKRRDEIQRALDLIRSDSRLVVSRRVGGEQLQSSGAPPAPGHGARHFGLVASALPARVDALRRCAVHTGARWAAVYTLDPPEYSNPERPYQYSGSIRLGADLYRTQYAPGSQVAAALDNRFLTEEECAWCGTVTLKGITDGCGGAFECKDCGELVCGGLSTGLYFRCYCGSEGWAVKKQIRNVGLIPGLR